MYISPFLSHFSLSPYLFLIFLYHPSSKLFPTFYSIFSLYLLSLSFVPISLLSLSLTSLYFHFFSTSLLTSPLPFSFPPSCLSWLRYWAPDLCPEGQGLISRCGLHGCPLNHELWFPGIGGGGRWTLENITTLDRSQIGGASVRWGGHGWEMIVLRCWLNKPQTVQWNLQK